MTPLLLVGPLLIIFALLSASVLYWKFRGRLFLLYLLYWAANTFTGTLMAVAHSWPLEYQPFSLLSGFGVSYINARLLEAIADLKSGARADFVAFIAFASMTALFCFLKAEPILVAMPASAALAFPVAQVAFRVLKIRRGINEIEIIACACMCIVAALHCLDYPFIFTNPDHFLTGYAVGLIIIIGQISFLKAAIMSKIMNDSIRYRDDFMSVASHELKTPITALKLLMQFTQKAITTEGGILISHADFKNNLSAATQQVDRLSVLVSDLLNVVRIRSGQMKYRFEAVDLSSLTKDIVSRYQPQITAAQCSLQVDIEPSVIGHWDKSRIEQVIVNLLNNSIKYAAGRPIQIRVLQSEKQAEFWMNDSGPGIPSHLQSKIFDRFERAASPEKVNGLGLGLFIVKEIVTAHGGKVTIESQESKGASFKVYLPIVLAS